MKKSNWKNKIKKVLAAGVVMSVLLSLAGVNGNTNEGIMPCGLMAEEVGEL